MPVVKKEYSREIPGYSWRALILYHLFKRVEDTLFWSKGNWTFCRWYAGSDPDVQESVHFLLRTPLVAFRWDTSLVPSRSEKEGRS